VPDLGCSVSLWGHSGDPNKLDAPTTHLPTLQAAVEPEDPESWHRIVSTYRDPLFQHCRSSGLAPEESEEVTMDVLARLSGRLQRKVFDWSSIRLRSWLAETTNHRIFEVHRSRKRHHLDPSVAVIVQEWLPPAQAPESDVNARTRMESHLWSVCLARVQSGIQARHWQIFEAYALQDTSAGAVATRFGTTAFNVRLIRHRVIRRIRQEWSVLLNAPLPDLAE
jgi:RNA polymerase sigma factor (sigma-70 family)